MSRRNLISSTCSVLTTGGTAIRLMSTDDLMTCDDRFARKLKKKTIAPPPLPTPLKASSSLKPQQNSFRFPNGEVFNPRTPSLTSLPPKTTPPVASSLQFRGGKVKQLLQKFQQAANQCQNQPVPMPKKNGYKRKSNSQKTQLANQLRSLVSDIATNLKDTSMATAAAAAATAAASPSSAASSKDHFSKPSKLQLHNICTTQLLVLLQETDSNPLLLLNYNRSNSNTPTTSISNSIDEEVAFPKSSSDSGDVYAGDKPDSPSATTSTSTPTSGAGTGAGTSSEEVTLKELFNDNSTEISRENLTPPLTSSTTSPRTPEPSLDAPNSKDLDPMDESSSSDSDSDLDSNSAYHVTEESRTTFIDVPEEDFPKGDPNRGSRDVSLVSINDKILEDVNKEPSQVEKDETSIIDLPEHRSQPNVILEKEQVLDLAVSNDNVDRLDQVDGANQALSASTPEKVPERVLERGSELEYSPNYPSEQNMVQQEGSEPAQMPSLKVEKHGKTIKVDPTAKPTPYSEFKVVRRNLSAPTYNYDAHNAPHRMVATMEAGRLSSMPTEADMALFMAANQVDEDDVPPRRDIVGRNYSLRRMKEILLAGNSTNSDQKSETSPKASEFEVPPPVTDASFRQSVLALMLLVECIPFPTSRPQLVAEVEVEGDDTLIEDESIQRSPQASIAEEEQEQEQERDQKLELVANANPRGSGSSTSSSNSHTLTSAEATPTLAESASQAPVHHVKSTLNKRFNRAEYTISPIIESPPGSPFPSHPPERLLDNNFPSPTIGQDISYISSSINENLQGEQKKLPPTIGEGQTKPDHTPTVPNAEFSKPLPKAPLKKPSLTFGKPKSEPSSRNTSSSTLKSSEKGPKLVGFFKKFFKKDKKSMYGDGSTQSFYMPADMTNNSKEMKGSVESVTSSPNKEEIGNLDDILPTLEPDTDMFDDVLTNLDKYSRGSMLIRKSEPIFCDDELTTEQIEDPGTKDKELNIKDISIKDMDANNLSIIGLQAPPKTFGKKDRLLVAGSVSLTDYIDDNILLLRREMGWMDQELLDQRLEMVQEAPEVEPVIEKSEDSDFKDPYEPLNETFTIYNEQLQNLFHNLTEGQRRALPMHLKYIRQFKDYAQLEITVKTEKFDVPPLNIVPKRGAASNSKKDGNPKKLKVAFENKIFVNETHSPDTYKRYGKLLTQSTLSEPHQIDRIKVEMNEFKCNEMLVHELLKKHTHFFY